jgi:hypothetical protein
MGGRAMLFRGSLRLLVAAVGLAAPAAAADYVVEFDCYDPNPNTNCQHTFGVRGAIRPGDFTTQFVGWGSYGHAKGSRLTNESGKTLRAIHIKVNGTPDTLRHHPSSPGHLFREIWRKKDGKEMIFNGANVPDNTYCWSRVLPRTPGFPKPYFVGRASEADIPVPDDGNWERVYPLVEAKKSKLWTSLIDATPNRYRQIQAYHESGDGAKVLVVSNDDILLYDNDAKTLRPVILQAVTPAGINRVTVEKGDKGEEYVLWLSGTEVAWVALAGVKLGSVLGKATK